MSENDKIGKYKFVAEPFHVDFTGRLTMGVLGNQLKNCMQALSPVTRLRFLSTATLNPIIVTN